MTLSTAVAQGILAQMRMFGGSLGIAASSAILSKSVEDELGAAAGSAGSGAVNPEALQLSDAAAALLRVIYSNAFRKDMWLSAIMAALATGCAFLIFKKSRRTIDQIQEEQVLREIRRRRAKAGSVQQA